MKKHHQFEQFRAAACGFAEIRLISDTKTVGCRL